jgi:hypothetical protein
MTENNINNFVDGFRPSSRSTPPKLRRDLNYRQPARPIIRGNYVNSEVNQAITEQAPVNISSAPAVQQNPTLQPIDNEFVLNDQTNHLNVIRQQRSGNIPQSNTFNTGTTLDDDLDSLFPKNENTVFSPHPVGSDLVIKKPRLPTGVYLIFIINLLLVLASFMIRANTSIIMSLVLIIGFILSFLLILKKNLARKYMIYFSIVIIAISLTLTTLFYLQARSTNAQFIDNYNQIKAPTALNMSTDQKWTLASNQIKVIATRDKQNKAKYYFYGLCGFIVIESVFIILYLRRPKVKTYFVPDNNPASSEYITSRLE